jgi:hypothetical protein
MARLYHKQYRRGGGRRGGFLKASPDPVPYGSFSDNALGSSSAPTYLSSVTDEWFATQTITRLTTDGGDFPAANTTSQIGHMYSKRPAETGDNILTTNLYPPRVLAKSDGAYQSSYSGPYVYPSRIHPGRVYGEWNSNTDFGYSNISGGGTTVIFDNGATYSACSMGYGEGQLDANEEYAALVLRRTSDNVYVVVCLRLSDGNIMGTWSTGSTTNSSIDNCTMSPDGQRVIVQTLGTLDGKSSGLQIFDNTMTYERRIAIGGGGSHIDYGFLEDGKTCVACWVSASNNALEYYLLSDGSGPNVVIPSASNFWLYNTHISMRCLDRPGYVYVCTFDYNSSTGNARPGHNAIIAVRLATGEVEGWAHAQHTEGDYSRYHAHPFASPSWDGKTVYFNSVWRATGSTANAHMYMSRRLR